MLSKVNTRKSHYNHAYLFFYKFTLFIFHYNLLMIRTKQKSGRSNSFIELSRIFFLLFLIIGHSGYIMVFAGHKQFLFYQFADARFFLNLSSSMTIGFAAITGLYVFNEKNLALKNLSRIFYIIVVNFVLGIIILLSTGFGVGDGHIV